MLIQGMFVPSKAQTLVAPVTPTPPPAVPASVSGISESVFNAFKQQVEDRFNEISDLCNELIDKRIAELNVAVTPLPVPTPDPALLARIAELETENAKLLDETIMSMKTYCNIRKDLWMSAELDYDKVDAEKAYNRFSGSKQWRTMMIHIVKDFINAMDEMRSEKDSHSSVITDDEVIALCEEYEKMYSERKNIAVRTMILDRFSRESVDSLRWSLDRYFRTATLSRELRNLASQKGFPFPYTEAGKNESKRLVKEQIIDNAKTMEDVLQMWIASNQEPDESEKVILQIASEQGYTPEVEISKEDFDKNIKHFANDLRNSPPENKDQVTTEAENDFARAVNNYNNTRSD